MIAAFSFHGQPIPDKLIPPELDELERWYWDCFIDLSTCRPQGFSGPTPIPWTAIKVYNDYQGLVGDSSRLFFSVMKSMDSVYLSHSNRDEKGAKNR